ncbi:MAG: 30S ribosomal protein S17 [Pelagibacterales bacterium]|nr:30S ribosomal protein S17 [Pelagibacterales bacterium]
MKVKVLNIIDEKTFKGIATTLKKHSVYGKYVTVHKKYLVDSCGQKLNVGDEVEITSSRPISKRKKWALKV